MCVFSKHLYNYFGIYGIIIFVILDISLQMVSEYIVVIFCLILTTSNLSKLIFIQLVLCYNVK